MVSKNGNHNAQRSHFMYDDDGIRVFIPCPYTVDILLYGTIFRLICSRIESKYVHVDLARVINSPVSARIHANTAVLCRDLKKKLEDILGTPVKKITPDLLDLEVW